MLTAYGITTLISLAMVGLCVLADKKRDIWLLLLFVSVSICNLGYFMTAISKDLADALNSNRIAYLGSVFLPYFLLMMVLRFCGIRRSNRLTILLGVIGVIMLAITTSPGILPIYYKTVDIAFTDHGTKLVREYGPLHKLYYVYLIGYMLSMIGVALYAISKKKIKSRNLTVLLLCAVFCNIVIWLVEQLLPRGFEWLSVSYIITEALILTIYRSMEKQGLTDLRERTQTYTINLLLAVFLLFFANFVNIVTKDTTKALYVVSQIVSLMIYIGILAFWWVSVYDRLLNKGIRIYLIALVALMMLWMLLRTLRHTIFYYVFPYGQWCWYGYYISMILIPQLCVFAANHIGKPEDYRLPKPWLLLYIPSLLLIGAILANDLHQLAFSFPQGYEQGWSTYTHGPVYYLGAVWIFGCIAIMIGIMLKRCRIPGPRKTLWLPIAMLGIGTAYSLLYAVNSGLFGFIEMPVALCFTVVAIWESSIKTGLIPSNSHYDRLLRSSGLGMTVVDESYTIRYASEDALPLSPEDMKLADSQLRSLRKGIRISKAPIRSGHVLWQEDVSELMDVLEELTTLREDLKDSNAISMENYQMDKKIRALEEKNRIHDELHRQTAHQIDLMNRWLTRLEHTSDLKERRELLRRIVVVGAYLKRRNNLILIYEQDGFIREEELNLSIKEMMKNLQMAGVECACSMEFDRDLPTGTARRLFDFYEYVVENAFDGLQSLLARFFCRDGKFYGCIDAMCTLDLRTLQSEEISVSLTDDNYYTLSIRIEGGQTV